MTRITIAAVALLALAACSGTSDATGSTTGGNGTSGGGSTGGSSGGTTGGGTTGGGADTFASWASPDFFQMYCTTCHSTGQSGDPSGSNLDWTSYPDVQLNANDIRCGVAVAQDPSWHCPNSIVAKQFPIGSGPHPSDAERERLVSWIDAGLPQN